MKMHLAQRLRAFRERLWLAFLARDLRSPRRGLRGILARRRMRLVDRNGESTKHAIQHRLDLTENDTIVELGAGEGAGLMAILESPGVRIPSKICLVETSSPMRKRLEGTLRKALPKLAATTNIDVHEDDCLHMPFLESNSVDKIFGMNVVYFLDPLGDYLEEFHRVLKPGGEIVWGCKFHSVPRRSRVFANTDEDAILAAMKEAGFQVRSQRIDVAGDHAHQGTPTKPRANPTNEATRHQTSRGANTRQTNEAPINSGNAGPTTRFETKQVHPIGTIIGKKFEGGEYYEGDGEYYEGEVEYYFPHEDLYQVRYSDGDTEDFTAKEITEHKKSRQAYSRSQQLAIDNRKRAMKAAAKGRRAGLGQCRQFHRWSPFHRRANRKRHHHRWLHRCQRIYFNFSPTDADLWPAETKQQQQQQRNPGHPPGVDRRNFVEIRGRKTHALLTKNKSTNTITTDRSE